ncbi:MAG: hypothetical protein Q9195_004849 [Heterodermia aff. obscurata]
MRSSIPILATISTAIASQVPLEHVPTCMTAAKTGYSGPGYYNILSYLSPSNVAVSLSKPVINSSVVAKVPYASDYTQSWLFADVGNGHVTIINNVTGGILSASKSIYRYPAGTPASTTDSLAFCTGDRNIAANVTPPYSADPNGIWSIDNTTWGGPVM